jgi:Ca2+-transporting ATPase
LLNALQLLWLNLIVHIFPALGLVLQRNWEDMMTEPPRNPKGALLNVQLWQEIMFRALIVTAMTLVGSMVLTDGNPQTTSTIALSIIGFSLVFQSWTWFKASSRQSLQMLPMAINSLIAAGLLIAASSVPWLRTLLGTTLLSQTQFLQVLLFSLAGCVPFVCIKPLTDKAVTRNRARGKSQFILGDDRFTYQE